jgi:hypothetical protein
MQLGELPPLMNIPVAIRMLEKYSKDIFMCPCCHNGRLQLLSSKRYFKSQSQQNREIMFIHKMRNKASPMLTQ